MTCEKPLDLSRSIQTRDGLPARIICTDAKDGGHPWTIIALLETTPERETVLRYSNEGLRIGPDSPTYLDLVNVPTKREVWVARLSGCCARPRRRTVATDPKWCFENPEAAAAKIDALWRAKEKWMKKWEEDYFNKLPITNPLEQPDKERKES